MNKIFLILMAILTMACGNPDSYILEGQPGPQGEQGIRGEKGQDGLNGISCAVTQVLPDPDTAPNGGALITCGTASTLILNGVDGQNGQDGQDAPPTAYSVVDMIDPCGKQATFPQLDEVFLLLANGQLISSFSEHKNGKNTRLVSLLPEAGDTFSGITTDDTGCTVSISRSVDGNTASLTTSNGIGGTTWNVE